MIVFYCEYYHVDVLIWFVCCCISFLFLFFKQKTAYEMRISDWSSDVCSSDLTRSGSHSLCTGSERQRSSGACRGRPARWVTCLRRGRSEIRRSDRNPSAPAHGGGRPHADSPVSAASLTRP